MKNFEVVVVILGNWRSFEEIVSRSVVMFKKVFDEVLRKVRKILEVGGNMIFFVLFWKV